MEALLNNLKHQGKDLNSSPSLRLERRPSEANTNTRNTSKPVVAYGAMEEMQSGWTNSQKSLGKVGKPQHSQSKAPSQSSRKKLTRKSIADSDGSDDEMDLLSSRPGSDNDASTVTKSSESKARLHSQGSYNDELDKRHVYAGLKFKKNKPAGASSGSSQPGPPSSQSSTSHTRSTASKASSPASKCPSPPTPVPTISRPRPRPIQKTKTVESGSDPRASSSKIAEDHIAVDEDEDEADAKRRTKPDLPAKRKPAVFPMLSLTSPPPSRMPKDFPGLSPLAKSKSKENIVRKPQPYPFDLPPSKNKVSGTRAPAAFPVSPVSKVKTSRVPAAFPMSSPMLKGKSVRSKNNELDKGKGKAKAQSDDDGDEEDDDSESAINAPQKKGKKNGRKPAPFPMSTQVLADIGDTSRPRSGKRFSPVHSYEDRDSKKTKRDVFDFDTDFVEEGDSILMPIVDPKTLCPFCDTPLPSNPSPLLVRLLAATKQKSSRDPRPANPLGRKAPLGIFIVVCQRHQFESRILPEAELQGWPKSIDWNHLGSRVRQMKQQLQALINDVDLPTNDGDWDVAYNNSGGKAKKTPRDRCIFWMEIIEEVKAKGTRSLAGVHGQFANFDRTQPGYYGELGSAIIQQTLYDLFPPNTIDPAVFLPLTANEFVQRVMVPEVAVRLIMNDQSLEGEEGMKSALTILRESSSYGAAMFPDDSAEAGKKKGVGMEASEQIVFDRAMKRRRELEEEDLREEQARQEESTMDVSDEEEEYEKIRKRKPTCSSVQESDAQDSDYPPIIAKPKPKPKPVAKVPSVVLDPTKLPPRSRSRIARSAASTDIEIDGVETTAEMSSNDSDVAPPSGQRSNVHRATSEDRRRSPSIGDLQLNAPARTRLGRSSKASMTPLSLSDNSECEQNSKGTASRKTRSSSRAPSPRPLPSKKVRSSSDMEVDSDSSGLEIIKNDNLKTPKPKPRSKAKPPSPVLNDDTPKPATRTTGKGADIAPLLRARNRPTQPTSLTMGNMNASRSSSSSGSQSRVDFQVNRSKSRGPVKAQPSQDYGWLLSE